MVIPLEAALISPPEGLKLHILDSTGREVGAELAAAEGVPNQLTTITGVLIGVLFCPTWKR